MTRKNNEDNNLEKKDLEYKFQGTGLTVAEKRWAKSRFRDYRTHYHIDSLSDLQLLEEMAFREALQERYKTKIGKLAQDKTKKPNNIDEKKKETTTEVIPTYILKFLDENLERILILKEKLGLFETKKENDFNAFQVLDKKFRIWKENHIEERKVTCPFCSEIFFLNIRTDKYKESKLKLFKNKILCNNELWKCYKEGLISEERFAKILNVSPDYILWLEKKIYNEPSK